MKVLRVGMCICGELMSGQDQPFEILTKWHVVLETAQEVRRMISGEAFWADGLFLGCARCAVSKIHIVECCGERWDEAGGDLQRV